MRTIMVLLVLLVAEFVTASNDPLTFVGLVRDKLMYGVDDVVMSEDRRHVYLSSFLDNAITIFERDLATGQLQWQGAVKAADLDPGVLDRPEQLAISLDDENVYAGVIDGLLVFERNTTTGELSFLEKHTDGEGGITTLNRPDGVVVSPDDKQLLVSSSQDRSLSVFSRNTSTGSLSLMEAHVDGTAGVNGLDGAQGVAVSLDGSHVYVAAYDDDAVSVFDRNTSSGALSYLTYYRAFDGIAGLDMARAVEVSPDGQNVYVGGSVYFPAPPVNRWVPSITVFERDAVSGFLSYLHHVHEEEPGLGALSSGSLVASPDGQNLYASGSGVVVFSRASGDGSLVPFETVDVDEWTLDSVAVSGDGEVVLAARTDEVSAYSRALDSGALERVDREVSAWGVDGPVGISTEFYPCIQVAGEQTDWNQVLISGDVDSAPAVMRRSWDYDFGRMRDVVSSRQAAVSYWADHENDAIVMTWEDAPSPCSGGVHHSAVYSNGEAGILGLNGPQQLAMSPDEKQLYAAALVADAVVVFSRDSLSNELSYVETHFDGVGPIDALNGAYWVEPSPDGAHVYVAAFHDDAVTGFSRDAMTGELSFMWAIRDGDGGTVDGLNGASSVVLSPDGRHAYVAGREDNAVALFSRSPSTGALSYLGQVKHGVGGVNGLLGARALAVSPDGEQLYVASQNSSALVVFSRDPLTGLLTQVGLHEDGVAGVDGLNTANGIAVSPNGLQIHVAGYGDDAVATFSRYELVIFRNGFEEGHLNEWNGVVPNQ